MEVLLPEAGMIETKMKQGLEYTCSALPQSLLHAPRGGDEVLHTQTRPDQSYAIWMVKCVFSGYTSDFF